MHANIADRSFRDFYGQIADPDIFCGGGSVAAFTAAGAAATALLVMRLNERRRSNAGIREQLQAAIVATEAQIERFYDAAEADIATLNELLATQRALKTGGSQAEYLRALKNAAESPLMMSEQIADLLVTVSEQMSISTRFTMSDLGAAAVLVDGACRAALLTAEVNIALLREADGADVETADAMESRRASTHQRVASLSAEIEKATRVVLQGSSQRGGQS